MLITKSCFRCATQPCLQPEGPSRFNELTCQQRSVHPPEKCSYSWGELWWLFSTAGGPVSSWIHGGSRGMRECARGEKQCSAGVTNPSSVTGQWGQTGDSQNMLWLLVWKVGHIQHCKWESDSSLTQRIGLFLFCHCNFFECREVHPPTDYFTQDWFCALWLCAHKYSSGMGSWHTLVGFHQHHGHTSYPVFKKTTGSR